MVLSYGPLLALPTCMNAFEPGRPILAVLNPTSGWRDRSGWSEKLSNQMQAEGIPLEVALVRQGVDVPGRVREARSRVQAVIAGGGDGTLNAVALGLQGSDTPMAIMPIGTLNHLARDLGIPLDTGDAMEALRHSKEVTIDLGSVNGRVFLNNSILGLYPFYRFARERRQRMGFPRFGAIVGAMLAVFRGNPAITVRLKADGREILRRTPYILIANNEHRMEGYQLGTRDRLDSGYLWIYVMRPRSRWGLLRMTLALLFGRFRRSEDFEVFPARHLRVETRRRRIGVALDGDVVPMATPLEYSILPKALRVMAPKA